MRLGLIGKSISHSLSPSIYKNLIAPSITYDLLDFNSAQDLPSLSDLAKKYDGLNITSPYKRHYFNEVIITDESVATLGAVNALSFHPEGVFATNTDYIAVDLLMEKYLKRDSQLRVVILGDGVMAQITQLICKKWGVEFSLLNRKRTPDLATFDFRRLDNSTKQLLIINACSRDYILSGKFSGQELFWDYNYNFLPHQNTLPSLVKEYQDGQEMLLCQAQAAVDFWRKKRG